MKNNVLKVFGVILLAVVLIIAIYVIGSSITSKDVVEEKTENSLQVNGDEIESLDEENNIENEVDNETNELDISVEEKEKIEEEAKEVLEKYLPLSSYERSNIGAMPYLLAELELEEKSTLDLLCTVDSTSYIQSDVKYEDFKNALLEYVTEEYFETYFIQYKDMNGYVGFQNVAAGLGAAEVESVELVSIEDGNYVFDVIFKDLELYEHYENGEEIEENSWLFYNDVIFKYENDKFVISELYDALILLDGDYGYENSDVGYEFYSDGTVEYSTNMSVDKGTYVTIDKNVIELVFTERISYEEDYENSYVAEEGHEIIPFKENVSEIDRVEKVTVVNADKIIVEGEVDGETYKDELIRFDVEN